MISTYRLKMFKIISKKYNRVRCEVCGKDAVFMCSACKLSNYCSVHCQVIFSSIFITLNYPTTVQFLVK